MKKCSVTVTLQTLSFSKKYFTTGRKTEIVYIFNETGKLNPFYFLQPKLMS